jgi:hypothetical protein
MICRVIKRDRLAFLNSLDLNAEVAPGRPLFEKLEASKDKYAAFVWPAQIALLLLFRATAPGEKSSAALLSQFRSDPASRVAVPALLIGWQALRSYHSFSLEKFFSRFSDPFLHFFLSPTTVPRLAMRLPTKRPSTSLFLCFTSTAASLHRGFWRF